ncbi:DUF305 domain-containing protein [Pseudoduganella lutea]|uniref:DUF305 domain-containing protein n=2 Tax=Pseudoduganella lutea TaxID=321985 RepID=A0A4P6L966_9BURK|nr:DUF305 domain-containing protein [Pseudoduganella lutea]
MAERTVRGSATALIAICLASSASAHDMHQHGREDKPIHQALPASFAASNDRPFAQLMDEAMAVMDRDMQAAPMNGQPEHDFVTMMLPHHQGAVDMAKAVLLNTKDPELRNLALGIITEQQNEINVMRAWLARHANWKELQ